MQTLFTSDRMIVKGRQDISRTQCIIGSSEDEQKEITYIELEFIFQVNGKLTQYRARMEVVDDEEGIKGRTLQDWREWYAILELFNVMGYRFSEEGRIASIIKDWIIEVENRSD